MTYISLLFLIPLTIGLAVSYLFKNSTDGVAESWDDFAQFRTNYQWFHPPIHPAFMQRPTDDMAELTSLSTVACLILSLIST
ncbi:hypothetical protein [Nostoc cycadae]|uniref:hypothetical protein n=1 Tax=Nostoc cycadae TaxID=246795 RepID=UPI0011AFAB78|nr:hypothetical protein [Nostoc cycadae]